MKVLAAFALVVLSVASVSVPFPAAAQSQFSEAGAHAIFNRNDWNGLLAYGQAWAKAQPNNGTAYYFIARAYGSTFYHWGLGRTAEGREALHRAVQLDPQMVDAWVELGILDQEVSNWTEAATAFERAAQLKPDVTRVWDNLALSCIHTHQWQQAVQAVDNLEKYAKNSTDWELAGEDYYAVAPYYQPTPMYQKSKAAFQRALELDPRNAAAWTNLGTTEQALGNTNDAFKDYEKGARLGNPQGSINDANLRADIQACVIQRNGLMNQRVFANESTMGMAIASYNRRCAGYTGVIKVIVR